MDKYIKIIEALLTMSEKLPKARFWAIWFLGFVFLLMWKLPEILEVLLK